MFLFSGATKIFLSFNVISLHTIDPISGFIKPDIILRSVDLPIPLSPAIRPTSFFLISKFKSLIKRLLLKEKAKFFTTKLIFICLIYVNFIYNASVFLTLYKLIYIKYVYLQNL